MDAAEYRAEVKRILGAASADVATRLVTIHDAATERTDAVVIDVFVGQDGEGPFDVWARFEGTDGFALGRRLDDERQLFGVTWGERGWKPEVPPCPREWTRDQLEEIIVEVVAEWLAPLIPTSSPGLRWEVTSPEGTVDPRPLGVRHQSTS
ncbi:DUF6389 family protein [Rhodococcus sp. NPDC003348]